MHVAGQKHGLNSLEQVNCSVFFVCYVFVSLFPKVKAIHLHPEQFSVENGLLTPTFKMKRNSLKDYFKDQIAQMYASCQFNI